MNVNREIYREKARLHREFVDAPASGRIRKRRRMRQRRRKIFNTLFILLACVVAFAIGGKTLYNYFQDTAKILQPVDFDDTVDWENEIAMNFDKDIINFALLGFDRSRGRATIQSIFRPDTIMVMSVNFRTGESSMISIPRDTYVKIHGRTGHDKINHSYMYGYRSPGGDDPHLSGIRTTVRTIQDFLGGVPIHYYIALDMDAVVEIVDVVGGIYYDVEMPVRDQMGTGDLIVDKGYHLLNGKQFLEYVRFRAIGGDFGRVARQQNIMIEMFKQLRERGKLTQAPKIFTSLRSNIDTNLSLSQIGALALYGMEINMDDIKTYMFEGSGQYAPQGELDIYYLVVNERQRVELIKEVFGVDVPARPQITLPGRRPAEEEEDEDDTGEEVTDPDDEMDPEDPGEPGKPPGDPGDDDPPPPDEGDGNGDNDGGGGDTPPENGEENP